MSIIFDIIISPLEYIIENLFSIFYYNLGLELTSSIFFISFAVTLMSLPFYYRADKIRKEEDDKYSELKPYIDKIKRNFKNDEQIFMLQTLYRQHNYNPIMALRNSFSLLLQIPFFIAAYHFFSNLDLLNGYSIGVIRDFSKPDMLLRLNGLTINILPIIMTVINIMSCEVYLKSKSFKARIQPYLFALFFLVFLYNSPSALVLYWTYNNFFYLLKNKYMDDNNPIKFVYKLSFFMLFAYIICNLKQLENIRNTIYLFFTLLFPYIIIYLILKFRENKYSDLKRISEKLTLGNCIIIFSFSSLGLVLLQGLTIPLGLLTSDLSMFVIELNNTDNIIKYVINNLYTITGLYLFWGAIILYFIKKEYRACFLLIIMSLFVFSLVNYMEFGNNLGTIDTNLRFETEGVVEKNFGNISSQFINYSILILFLSSLFWVLKKNYIKQVIYVMSTLLLTVVIVSGVYVTNFVRGISYVDNLMKNNKEVWSQPNHIELSKSGKNVIVIVLDRFLGSFLPIMLNERPELKQVYSGFVFYPNTISLGVNTVIGYPPCVGGYEYSPFILDKDKRDFSEKWLEASLMLLTLFKNNNYSPTVVEPEGETDPNMRFYKNDNFTNLYASKGINRIKMYGKYNARFNNDELHDYKVQEQVKKRLYMYSFLTISPKNLKCFLYDNGFYMLIRRKEELFTHIYYSEKAVLNAYSSLLYLKNITTSDSKNNTFSLIHNDLSHCLAFFQYPNYEFSRKLTNIGINKFNDDYSFMAYHTSMATILLVGKYMDYLKKLGVYDNTRIIIAADHGNKYVHFPNYSEFENEFIIHFNPLLMIKDFNQDFELKTDNTFMTNADIPYLATKDLIVEPKNPFTGKIISKNDKSKGVDVYKNHKHWNTSHFTSNKVILGNPPIVKHVKDNIFIQSNWKDVKYE